MDQDTYDSDVSITCRPFFSGETVHNLLHFGETNKEKKNNVDSFNYYMAFWIGDENNEKPKEIHAQTPPRLTMQSNSHHFNGGFVSDMKIIEVPTTSSVRCNTFAITLEPIIFHVWNIKNFEFSNIATSRLYYTLYKKETEGEATACNSGKIASSSISCKDIFATLFYSLFVWNGDFIHLSLPLNDQSTILAFLSSKSSDKKDADQLTNLGKLNFFFSFSSPLNQKKNLKDKKCFYFDYTNMAHFVKSNFHHDIAFRAFWRDKINESEWNSLVKCFDPIFSNMYCVNMHMDATSEFNRLPEEIRGQVNILHIKEGKYAQEFPLQSENVFRDNVMKKINDEKIRFWLKMENIVNQYSEELSNIFEPKRGILHINRGDDHDNRISFIPDVRGLKNFKRYYWIIDNLRVPYPHFTKVCLPKILPNGKIESKSSTNKPKINEDTERLFCNILNVSCAKYGVIHFSELLPIIEKFFGVSFVKPWKPNNTHKGYGPWADRLFYDIDPDGPLEKEFLNRYINLDKQGEEYQQLLKCIEIIGDFLCSISCSMNYRFDTRARRARTSNKNDSTNEDPGFVYQHVDSIDFDALAGLNEQGDCDELGIFIAYIFVIMVNGRKEDVGYSWESPTLRAISFLLLHYVDYCVFGVVDDAKFESNSNNTDERDDDDSNKSRDYLYNEYDKESPCQTGHTFVILNPIKDLETTMIASASSPSSDSNLLYGISLSEIKNKFKNYYDEVYAMFTSSRGESTDAKYINKRVEMEYIYKRIEMISSILPKMILEGTGRQNVLMNYGEFYYGEGSQIAKSLSARPKINHIISSISKAINHKNVSNKNEYDTSFNNFQVCDFQSNISLNDTFDEEAGYSKRCVDFYRRAAFCTSQVLRFVFTHNESDMRFHSFDNLIWVNHKHRRWGVPIRHILENKNRNVVPIPMPRNLLDTYLERTSTNFIKDNVIYKNSLHTRFPPVNLHHFEGNVLSESFFHKEISHNGSVNEQQTKDNFPPGKRELLQKMVNNLVILLLNSDIHSKLKNESITTYWVIKPESHGIYEEDIDAFKMELDESLKKLGHYIKLLSKTIEVSIREIYQRTLPWFGEEIVVIVTLKRYLYG